jgi:hypothetical protein
MFERLNRWEYDHPVLVPLLTAGLFVGLSFLTGDRLFVVVAIGIAGARMWGMRPGGHTRRSLEKKYGWTDDAGSGV